MRLLFALCLTACAAAPDHSDVVGPFTATPRRFVIDHLSLPVHFTDWSDDLDGDGRADDQLAGVIALLQLGANTPLPDDYLASGAVAPVLELIDDGATGAAQWRGADGEDADFVGGRFHGRSFTSNRDRDTTHPGSATVHLPIFLDADPTIVAIVGVEIELAADGADGWDGVLHGAIHGDDLTALTASGVTQMLTADPQSHQAFWDYLVPTGGGPITRDNIAQSGLFRGATKLDVQLFDAGDHWAPSPLQTQLDSMSIGFAFHATPCDAGRCGVAPSVTDACHDRVRDGAESDVDCGGGGCHACAGGLACVSDGDCQSGSCAGGVCAAPSCNDRRRDQFESDVDCGGPCAPCEAGRVCFRDADCASGMCQGVPPNAGRCQ